MNSDISLKLNCVTFVNEYSNATALFKNYHMKVYYVVTTLIDLNLATMPELSNPNILFTSRSLNITKDCDRNGDKMSENDEKFPNLH